MKFKNINPATEEVIGEYKKASTAEVLNVAKKVNSSFENWKNFDISDRSKYMKKLAKSLRKNSEKYAKTMTLEVGKPITQSLAEVEKCAWTAEVYAKNGKKWLEEETVKADGKLHKVAFEPLGTILSIMPWNFPFWQALRFAIPTLLAGNTSILKHSNECPQSALEIENSFKKAGFPDDVFKTIITGHDAVAKLIQSDFVQGVSLTGSTGAGSIVASLAGNNLKKFVLELGGSDPFIVLEDADPGFAAKGAVTGRTINTGQSCIAAKRFIVMESIAEEFSQKFAQYTNELKIGDPLKKETEIGPLVNKKQLEEVEAQFKDAVKKGAKVLAGGERFGNKGYFFKPTVLGVVSAKMKVVAEEVFGPIAPIIIVKSEEEAIKIANDSEFGLGASIWTKNENRGLKIAKKIEAGAVFINNIVKSDPRMPFGGIKKSGIGRELSKYGLKEFVNVKSINLYSHNQK